MQSKRPGLNLELARRSMELLAAFVAGREEDLSYVRQGSLILALSDEEETQLRDHHRAIREADVPVEWLGGEAARSLEPGLSPAVRAATFCPGDAQVHPGALAAAWLQDALAHGAAITSPVLVDSFVKSGGAVCGVVAGGAEYAASAVVLAAGPWSGDLAGMAGAAVDVRPRRGVLLRRFAGAAIASRPLLGAEYLCAKFGDDPCSVAFSFQQHPDGECVLGGSREFVEFSTERTDRVVERIRECGGRYLPVLRGAEWSRTEMGFRPWTPDGLPRTGACEVSGLYLASGHEGDGIMLAAATAERIAAALADSR
jgi:D-hydroxyproline dehydrogenase subunit beta